MKPEIERGMASMLVELVDGNITVKHGDDGTVLLEKKNVEDGSWDRIWELLRNLRTVE